MTPAMVAALKDGRVPKTGFFEVGLPDGTRYLQIGAGKTRWGGNVYKGNDPTFGYIDSADNLSEGDDGVAPNTSFSIIPSPTADRSVIAAPTVQLSPVKIYVAALTLDVSQHVVAVADPDLLWFGYIDQATTNEDRQTDDIDYTLISGFDYFFEDSEGQRLNGAFHQTIWPGEKGMDNVTGVSKKIYWGGLAPPGTTTGTGSIYGAGGAGGGSYSPVSRFDTNGGIA